MAELSHLTRILVVEDDGLIALNIENTLQDAGVGEVILLASVEDALVALDAVRFTAAVLDVQLGRHGRTYAVAERLRQERVPFVFSSGSDEIADAFRDVPLIMKPFSSEQLITALAQITFGTSTAAA